MEKGTKDSWEIDGDCSKCRRNTYCSKPCKKAKLRKQKEIDSMLGMAISETKLGSMTTMISNIIRQNNDTTINNGGI